uniref:Magnesium-dependent phosphatase-1 n=1 Tax=Chromera velia CCMP2878 TaxID=1169474 RepID=A0A0G4G5P0_9ALVE|mmetsp:Transcript_34817/g.68741  ORF Transcript_34817/g.68741 Transcript_34817/m.68741 type:complete len:373 (+) Transcript_34817:323-1441(+)|eukprot:Cvel_20337.t1-p1 / transcript=Cvel_20337.t1 / gene=Cvel_20337 / organism=Chromera_velia_CCMP2878 / gene_product=Magnesium-dependent phosphatase 1, putative / transcript_product=Magnesium-dependent phosphatase 1, putative / location=Cvel_scaffold1817:11790-12905(+) / protein_length=372 / sequence_SO=supercontig / SO=protein_coding / is_pseudo=false
MSKRPSDQSVAELTSLFDVVVFDLDFTLWTSNVHELTRPLSVVTEGGDGWGVSGNRHRDSLRDAKGRTLSLYPHTRNTLEVVRSAGLKIGIASHSHTGSLAREALTLFALMPLLDADLIFIQPPSFQNSSKTVHLRKILQQSNVTPGRVLFLDDIQRNVTDVGKIGVQGYRVTTGVSPEILLKACRSVSQASRARSFMSAWLAKDGQKAPISPPKQHGQSLTGSGAPRGTSRQSTKGQRETQRKSQGPSRSCRSPPIAPGSLLLFCPHPSSSSDKARSSESEEVTVGQAANPSSEGATGRSFGQATDAQYEAVVPERITPGSAGTLSRDQSRSGESSLKGGDREKRNENIEGHENNRCKQNAEEIEVIEIEE